MPGVPSGRGCDGCRQQKKKCDLTNFPCARCKRLNVPCVGLGQRRFKFVQDERTPSPGGVIRRIALSRTPSNDVSRITAAFTDKIKPNVGVQYNLAWTYGDYLALIPARLGTNEALDAATDAFTTAVKPFFGSGLGHTQVVLEKYGTALAALRKCLDDPVKARSPETLSAILFLWNSQPFAQMSTGTSPTRTHAQGIAQIIRIRGCAEKSSDPFEMNLLLALRAVVLFDSIFDGPVEFSDDEWSDMFHTRETDPSLTLEGHGIQCMTRLPNLMRRTKATLLGGAKLQQTELPGLRKQADDIRAGLEPVLSKLRQRWLDNSHPDAVPEGLKSMQDGPLKGTYTTLFKCHYLRSYGLGVAIAIIVNEVRLAQYPDALDIVQESHGFALAVLEVGRLAAQYRPFGAYAVGVCLLVAQMGTDDHATKAMLQQMRYDYGCDFAGFEAYPAEVHLICGREWGKWNMRLQEEV